MTLNNDYEVPMLVEIGRARDVILGSIKWPLLDDSPLQGHRVEDVMADDE